MKKQLIGISAILVISGCGAPDLFLNNNHQANIESVIDQKTVHTYIEKAIAHLSTAPNYNQADVEERLLKMASDSFHIPVNEVRKIYTAYEYNE